MQLADKPEKSTGKSVKLPKLVIAKYDRTFKKWLSFWNTFKAEVDSQDIPVVTKFEFLRVSGAESPRNDRRFAILNRRIRIS